MKFESTVTVKPKTKAEYLRTKLILESKNYITSYNAVCSRIYRKGKSSVQIMKVGK